MKPATIHHLNSGLIILSCLVSFFIPFELFLFSYGVLGPLHYLTEIGWLHKKNYFTKGKYDFLFLVLTCSLLVYWNFNPSRKSQDYSANVIMFSLLASIAFVFIKDWLYRFVVFALAIVSIVFLSKSPEFFTWAAVFLPTIIHVFIFTWAFMVYGVLKEKSIPGLISILVLIVCSVILFTIQPEGLMYEVSNYTRKSYGPFQELNFRLVNFFNLDQFTQITQVFTTKVGFVMMRFIAFAYTYHYLNWFSKTSVIKWHQVSKSALVITAMVWLLSVALYVYDYSLGLKMLFFLSFLHVFLEFPLNVVSFSGIGREVLSFAKKRG
ncbi:MAG: hypothetical protein IT236_18040 [Bacteroidia bacterium]|nr:hypothetical protein [Bacteroidia bacterium]